MHALIHIMTGDGNLVVSHNKDGRPFIDGWHVSISHTRGYAAVILSRQHDVSVDIQAAAYGCRI